MLHCPKPNFLTNFEHNYVCNRQLWWPFNLSSLLHPWRSKNLALQLVTINCLSLNPHPYIHLLFSPPENRRSSDQNPLHNPSRIHRIYRGRNHRRSRRLLNLMGTRKTTRFNFLSHQRDSTRVHRTLRCSYSKAKIDGVFEVVCCSVDNRSCNFSTPRERRPAGRRVW